MNEPEFQVLDFDDPNAMVCDVTTGICMPAGAGEADQAEAGGDFRLAVGPQTVEQD